MSSIDFINLVNDQIFELLIPDDGQKIDACTQTNDVHLAECYKISNCNGCKQQQSVPRENYREEDEDKETKLLFQIKKLKMNESLLKRHNEALKKSLIKSTDSYYEQVINEMQCKIEELMDEILAKTRT